MKMHDPITLRLTRAEYLVIADALIARRREGVERQKKSTIKLELGIGMQMAEDADNVLTKIGIQELEQVPPVIKPLGHAANVIAADAARTAAQCLAALEAPVVGRGAESDETPPRQCSRAERDLPAAAADYR
jgi:hypothetical protein